MIITPTSQVHDYYYTFSRATGVRKPGSNCRRRAKGRRLQMCRCHFLHILTTSCFSFCTGASFFENIDHLVFLWTFPDYLWKVVVMLRKGGKTATTKGITVSADSMLGEQVSWFNPVARIFYSIKALCSAPFFPSLIITQCFSSLQKKNWRRMNEHRWNSSLLRSVRGRRRKNCRLKSISDLVFCCNVAFMPVNILTNIELVCSLLYSWILSSSSPRKRSNNSSESALVGSETNTGVQEASGHQRFATNRFSSDWFQIWMHFREHQMPTSFLGVGREPHQSESSQRIAVQRCLLLSNCICHQLRVVITTTSVRDQWYIEG